MRRLRVAAALLATALLAFFCMPSPAWAAHALIEGSGSSWAANAINQWVADVKSQGMQVVFTANGSAQGRKDFALATYDFGASDIGYQGVDPETGLSDTSNRPYAYLPVVAGGTAFPYHLMQNGQKVRNVRLSGQTLAKIFTNKITKWSDPQITSDNNGHQLPDTPIIPVVHSEGSGASYMFTRYMSQLYPSIWAPFNHGKANPTEYFPRQGNQIAQSGSDGVMNFVTSNAADGSIGYDEYSYALSAGYPAIKVLNAAGVYTLPTQYNVAVALTKAHINQDKNSPDYLTQNLDDVYTNPDPRTYPLSSYAYMIIPTSATDPRMTTNKRQTLADYLYYSICQGQQEMGPIGYSSLPINLVQAGFEQIAKLKAADPKVDLTSRDVSTCNNPTFIAGQPNVNHLAQIAPAPPSCDSQGKGPCDATQGTFNANPASIGSTSGPEGAHGALGAAAGPAANGKNQKAGAGGTKIDPNTGQVIADGTDASAVANDVQGVSTNLGAADSPSLSNTLAAVAGVLFALLLTVPVMIGRRNARRWGGPR